MLLFRLFPLTMVLLLACRPTAGRGQQKQALTEKDYGLWSTLYNEWLSQNGDWVSYRKDYESRQDTLFARHIDSGKTYSFPGGASGSFSGDAFFNCLLPDSRLEITDLKTGLRQAFEGVADYHHLADGKYLLLAGTSYIEIRSAAGLLVKHVDQVTAYKVSPDGDKVLYGTCNATECCAYIYIPNRGETLAVLSDKTNEAIVNPSWNDSGNAVAFFRQGTNGLVTGVYVYGVVRKCLDNFEPGSMSGFPKSMQVLQGYNPMVVSGDGWRVFLRVGEADRVLEKPDSVQIWNGNDRFIYPQRIQAELMLGAGKLGMWDVGKQSFSLLTCDSLPKVMLDGSQRHAVTMNPMGAGQPQFKYDFDTDFYLTDLETGETDLWLSGHSTAAMHTLASPGGKYFAYRRGEQWYIYDLEKKTHNALTARLGEATAVESSGEIDGYDIVGWSDGDRSVFVSDGADLWEIDLVSHKGRRLTDSNKTGIAYKAVMSNNDIYVDPNFDGWTCSIVDPIAGVYLYGRGRDYKKSGYFHWSRKGGLKTVVYGDGLLDQARSAKSGNRIVYRFQQYDSPPALFLAGGKTKSRMLLRPNAQHGRFLWGWQELVHYTDGKGQALNGILYYPAGYVKGRHYPMVVSIYEKQSVYFHKYINPGFDDGRGFNVTEYTQDGYFVLLPDIVYEKGNPGGSALQCVMAAVAAVMGKGFVKPENIGLIGHSFGGYETNFIIGQTGMFAAAVSGAGVSDFRSAYLSVGNTGRPNMWRFEHQQLRMGKSIFEDAELYRRNSPIELAEKISTPLLLWAGSQDKTVPVEQSISFYLALRRLGKKQMMLLYPNERHALEELGNRKDLNRRILDWFDYFLKGDKSAKWIFDGMK